MIAARMRTLSCALAEVKQEPDPVSVEVGSIPIVSKVSFDGLIHLRERVGTRTKLITVPPGSLLMSGINATKGAIAVHPETAEPVAATIHYSAYQAISSEADVRYVWWLLRSGAFRHILKRHSPGGIKSELRARQLLSLPVPLPDLRDQKRLVAFFEEVARMSARAQEGAREARSLSDRTLRCAIDSVMGSMAVTGTFDDVVSFKPRSGPSFPTSTEWGGIPVLMPSAVTGFNVDPSKREFGPGGEAISPKDRLQPGDIVIARGNKRDQVGNAGVVPVSVRDWVCASLLMRMQVDPTKTTPEFMVYWLRFSRVRQAVGKATRGTSPSIQKINQRSILALPYPTGLSLDAQQRAVRFLTEVERRSEFILAEQRKIEVLAARLRSSIVTATLETLAGTGDGGREPSDWPPGVVVDGSSATHHDPRVATSTPQTSPEAHRLGKAPTFSRERRARNRQLPLQLAE